MRKDVLMEAKNILDYWKDLEFFSPDSITDSSYKNFSEGIKFPWLDNTETDCIFKVYLGNLSTNSIIMRMIDAIKAEDSRIEVDNSKSLICALNISENGFYIQESFNISHFVWACCQIIKNKTLDVELNENRIDQFNSEINSYICSLDRRLDKEVLVLKDLLNPKNYPFGKWPTAFNPSFMQQVAINLSTKSKEEGEIFSVNGPPGTGKTTLLKEIIADNIVKRAKVMTSYSKPSDAFKKVDFEHPTQYHKYYYELDELLCSYGMIVASNNNLAVENISCELPLLNSVRGGKSGIFDNCGDTDIYFNEIVSNILGEDKPTWGLISARLGNKENISKFINAYYYGSKENNKRHIRDYFEEEISWTNQKEKFDLKYAEVENYRHKIEEVFDRSIYT